MTNRFDSIHDGVSRRDWLKQIGLGVFNFGEVGDTRPVADEDARAVDRRRGHQITLYAVLIGAAAAALAVMIG